MSKSSLMECVREGDVVGIERHHVQELREEVAHRMADVGMGAHDETNYVTYWMASHRDHDVAHDMIRLFDRVVGRDPTVWFVFGPATHIAAKIRKNNKILSFLPPVQLTEMYDTDLF